MNESMVSLENEKRWSATSEKGRQMDTLQPVNLKKKLDYTVWSVLPPATAYVARLAAGKHRPPVPFLPPARSERQCFADGICSRNVAAVSQENAQFLESYKEIDIDSHAYGLLSIVGKLKLGPCYAWLGMSCYAEDHHLLRWSSLTLSLHVQLAMLEEYSGSYYARSEVLATQGHKVMSQLYAGEVGYDAYFHDMSVCGGYYAHDLQMVFAANRFHEINLQNRSSEHSDGIVKHKSRIRNEIYTSAIVNQRLDTRVGGGNERRRLKGGIVGSRGASSAVNGHRTSISGEVRGRNRRKSEAQGRLFLVDGVSGGGRLEAEARVHNFRF
ncbi:hypothetical protein LXL04_019731 [Taraxacum kok-saghyz]